FLSGPAIEPTKIVGPPRRLTMPGRQKYSDSRRYLLSTRILDVAPVLLLKAHETRGHNREKRSRGNDGIRSRSASRPFRVRGNAGPTLDAGAGDSPMGPRG